MIKKIVLAVLGTLIFIIIGICATVLMAQFLGQYAGASSQLQFWPMAMFSLAIPAIAIPCAIFVRHRTIPMVVLLVVEALLALVPIVAAAPVLSLLSTPEEIFGYVVQMVNVCGVFMLVGAIIVAVVVFVAPRISFPVALAITLGGILLSAALFMFFVVVVTLGSTAMAALGLMQAFGVLFPSMYALKEPRQPVQPMQ